ncbi:hypothetical protein ACFX1T_032243 [Malus domestica]
MHKVMYQFHLKLTFSDLVKRDTNHVVGVPQVAELEDLPKEVTDKVSNQSSKQSVPDQKFDFKFRLIVLILPILQAARRIKRRKRRKYDMRYFCF